jgi:hypothetical protein
MEITITRDSDFDRVMSELGDLSGPRMFAANAVVQFLRAYHGEEARWRGSNWMSPSLGFAQKVVEGWQDPVQHGNEIVIENTFGLLDWKVTGGTIVPRNATMLAIPLVSEAKGVSARDFNGKLFRVGNALCEAIDKGVRAVYALKESVTQDPWPGAMPPNSSLESLYQQTLEGEVDRIAKG